MTLKLNTLGDAESRDSWRARWSSISRRNATRCRGQPRAAGEEPAADPRQQGPARPEVRRQRAGDAADGEAEDFFGQVREGLDAAGVAYELDPHLVRGLDYYRHTAFEFVTDQLGAQGTVIAGGRYDGLVEQLGGPHTPAVGWAAGIERLAMMIDAPAPEDRSPCDRRR